MKKILITANEQQLKDGARHGWMVYLQLKKLNLWETRIPEMTTLYLQTSTKHLTQV